MIGKPKHAPPPPEEWPQDMRDAVERTLRKAVETMHLEFGALVGFYHDKGRERFDWTKPGRREWILARLAERMFPAWDDLGAHRIGDSPCVDSEV